MPKKTNILIVYNPKSGAGKAKKAEQRLSKILKRNNVSYSVLEVPYKQVLNQIRQKFNYTHIVVIGGDGSFQYALNDFIDFNPVFSILPSGSGNGFAYGVKATQNLNRLVSKIKKNDFKALDLMLVNEKIHVAMLLGFGFDAMVAEGFSREKKRGLLRYLKVGVNSFFKLKPKRFKIHLENKTILNPSAYMLCVSNINQFGNHIRIAPYAKTNDQKFDLFILKKSNKIKALFNMILQSLGFNKPTIDLREDLTQKQYIQASYLKIENLDNAPFHICGEPEVHPYVLEIKILPKALRFIG